MQALFQGSEEGISSGFGFINHECKKFESDTKKVPHIGWNQINIHKSNKLFDQIENKLFYFAHSYAFLKIDEDITLTTTNYINDFSSSIAVGNIYGVQFHPEKSFDQGKQLIKNFIENLNILYVNNIQFKHIFIFYSLILKNIVYIKFRN